MRMAQVQLNEADATLDVILSTSGTASCRLLGALRWLQTCLAKANRARSLGLDLHCYMMLHAIK